MIRTVVRTKEKPVIVIATDNSSSMVFGKDSAFVLNNLGQSLGELAAQLGDDYEVARYSFGEQVIQGDSIDFSDKMTDISAFFNEINNRYYNRNLGAVVIASDGIYNSGADPYHLVRDAAYPVYTINTGDTNQLRDLLIKQVNYNRLAYKGNRFPIEILLQAHESAGESGRIRVLQNETEIMSQDVRFISDKQLVTLPVSAIANESGKLRFRIVVDPIPGEVNETNNAREIIVEVKEGKEKVAILANSPHPDLAAIERAIGNSSNFETELYFSGEFNKNISDYSLFILHQIPSVNDPAKKFLADLAKMNVPVLYIIGNQSDIPAFNGQKSGLSLTGFNNSFNESLPVFNPDFPLFISSESLKQLLQIVPPLNTPFAQYITGNAAYTFARQAIGTSVTSMPLILFNQNPERKTGIITGEGIWRWRMADFYRNGNQLAFDELIGKMVQYLAVKGEKSRFRVSVRDYFAENEDIEFGATLFNESYELINDKLVTIAIAGEDGKKFEFEFSPSGDTYQLNAGNFKPGIYTYQASAETGTGALKQQGSYIISALNLEDINTVANHRLLNSLARITGGSGISTDRISEISDLIKSRQDVKPVTYTRKRFTDLVSFFPLLILIISMLSVEWFLRKFYGSY